MAKEISPSAIEMIETDYRFACENVPVNAARLAIVARNAASCEYRNEVLGLPNFVRNSPRRAAGKQAA